MDKGMVSRRIQSARRILSGAVIITLSLFFGPSAISATQDPKASAQIIFLAETFEFLHHSTLPQGVKLWEYAPSGELALKAKNHIILWYFPKEFSLKDAVQVSQEINLTKGAIPHPRYKKYLP